MEYALFDYQREAAAKLAERLERGRKDWTEDGFRSAFALSAATGAGKTVIATAVIEAFIFGSSDLGVDPSPGATFLWVTDDPALNRQTLNKMLAASDVLDSNRLVVLNNDFLDPVLRPGRVYFLNIQKLSKSSGLSHGGRNLRQYSMWDIISNTIDAEGTDLYLVLDEAHKGMKQATDRPTIVRRIIAGEPGSNKPVPVAWGISATIDRFITALKGTNERTMYPPVTVDIQKVRASGIVKDQIDLDEPDEKGFFSATLLRAAVDATLRFEKRWKDYSDEQGEKLVLPVLVVQVNDKPSDAQLGELVGIIDSQWPNLGSHAVVNVFGEHDDLVIGDRKVRWVSPESIQDEDGIRVVLAKQAISTGWDCPRAEVLYSERAATDATHIAQIIGRMVRTPLTHRIVRFDDLNSVSCFLPHFNRAALEKITNELTKPGEPGDATDVVVNAKLFDRNRKTLEEVFPFIEALPSLPPPDSLANPLRRAKLLATLLTDDAVAGGALLANAGAELEATLNSRLDGLAAEFARNVSINLKNIESAKIHTTSVTVDGQSLSTSTRSESTAIRDVDRETRKRIGAVKEGVAKDYVRYQVEKAGESADITRIRTEVAGLLMVDGVIAELEAAATKWVLEKLAAFNVEIKNTTGETYVKYSRVREQSSQPEIVGIELPMTLKAPTKDSNKEDAKDLDTFAGHLYSDTADKFPAKLNDWEETVITTEIDRPSFVAWYRNPSRSTPTSLRIAYQNDSREWGSLQIDFIVVSRKDDGSLAASIVDPHGDHLADAKAKLLGLADYAERFSDQFVRIESIAKTDDGLKSLDLRDPRVREAVRGFTGGKVTPLYESGVAVPYR